MLYFWRCTASEPFTSVAGSVLLMDEQRSGLGRSGSVAISMDGGASGDQTTMQLVEQQDAYISERANTMETIESTIVELGSIFQQLATMVKEQEEQVLRWDVVRNITQFENNSMWAKKICWRSLFDPIVSFRRAINAEEQTAILNNRRNVSREKRACLHELLLIKCKKWGKRSWSSVRNVERSRKMSLPTFDVEPGIFTNLPYLISHG